MGYFIGFFIAILILASCPPFSLYENDDRKAKEQAIKLITELCGKYYILEKDTLKEQLERRYYNKREIYDIKRLLNDLTIE